VTNTRWTDAADGIASSLGNVGAERFVYSQSLDVGTRR
jgi:hypothetical protein